MDQALEEKLLNLAIQKQIFSAADLQNAKLELQNSLEGIKQQSSSLVNFLIQTGKLNRDTIDSLISEILRSSSDSALDTFSQISIELQNAPEQFIESFGRYQRLEFLGRGGMANVYKGYDPMLDRVVALKFVRMESRQLTDRLMREARAQAKIDHDYVCKVYEVGMIDGKNYIAMQYIAGNTFRVACRKMTPAQIARTAADVADAIHAAHRAGLIHRDLKPSNIMVVQNEDSTFHPYVMDFGLAREVEAHGLTMSGAVIGTPSYMSPEQAAGKNVNSRSDIYSLGATLYEALSGHAPFTGNSGVEVLMNVIQKEPLPPRTHNTSIPEDLETIVLKAMEKEPERRYESARALGDDLRRFLDDSPVLARRSSWTYRTGKRLRKHPVTSALLAASLLIVLGAILFATFTLWRSKDQAQFANQFSLEIQDMQQRLRYFYSQPPHDVRAEEETIRKRLQKMETDLKQMRSAAQGPGRVAIGIGYLALGEDNNARQFLEDAWTRDEYKVPQAAFAYGLILVRLYGKELEQVQQYSNLEERQLRIKEIEKKYRDPALKLIEQGRSDAQSPLFAEALIAFLEKRYKDTLKQTEKATALTPWLYEADILKGDAFAALGSAELNTGKLQDGLALYKEAEKAYQEAIRKGPSDVRSHIGAASLQNRIMSNYNLQTNTSTLESFGKGVAACEKAELIRPDLDEVYYWYGRLYVDQFNYLSRAKSEGYEELLKGIDFYKKALHLSPERMDSNYSIGLAYRHLGVWEKEHGKDPRDVFTQAITYLNKAASLSPNSGYIFTQIGAVYTFLSQFELDRGLNARNSVDNAIANFKKALKLNSVDFMTAGTLGVTYGHRARIAIQEGQDPLPFFELGIESTKHAIRLNPRSHDFYVYLGAVNYWKAEYELNHGANPLETINQCIDAHDQVQKIRPSDPEAHGNTCEALNLKTEYFLLTGADALETTKAAINHCETAVKTAPNLDFFVVNLGIAYANLAEINLKNASEFDAAKKKSREALLRTLEINHNYPDAHFTLARLEILASSAQSKVKALDQARLHLQKALQINPQFKKAQTMMAESYLIEASDKLSKKQNAQKEISEGLKVCEKNGEKNSYMLAVQASLLNLKAQSESDSQSSNEAVMQSKKLANEALQLNANLKHRYSKLL